MSQPVLESTGIQETFQNAQKGSPSVPRALPNDQNACATGHQCRCASSKFCRESPSVKQKHDHVVDIEALVMLLMAQMAKKRKHHCFNDIFNTVTVLANCCHLHPYKFLFFRAFWCCNNPTTNKNKSCRLECWWMEEKTKSPCYERFHMLHHSTEQIYDELLAEELKLLNLTKWGCVADPEKEDSLTRKQKHTKHDNLIVALQKKSRMINKFWKSTCDLHKGQVLVDNVLADSPHERT